MKFVLFSEQHWSNYLGGCSIVYTRNCNLLAIPLLWFLSGPWPRENGVAMLSCPFHQVRMVGNTLKCSINALFFLVLPYCSTSLSYDYYISRVSSPPSHQLFFHGVTAGESRVRRGTIGPLGVPPGNWTAGSSCLKEDWRCYLGGGPLSGQVMVHNVIAYLSSLSVKQCQASISNTVAPENYSIITVLVMKKIAQNGSN